MHPIIKKWLLPIGRAIVCLFCLATVLLYLPVAYLIDRRIK